MPVSLVVSLLGCQLRERGLNASMAEIRSEEALEAWNQTVFDEEVDANGS